MWSKHLKANADFAKEYKARDPAAKDAARRDWAKETFSHVLATKSFTKDYKEVETREGVYMTFGSLVQSFGGWEWQPAILGAKRHSLKCIQLGGKWFAATGLVVLPHRHPEPAAHVTVPRRKGLQYQNKGYVITWVITDSLTHDLA